MQQNEASIKRQDSAARRRYRVALRRGSRCAHSCGKPKIRFALCALPLRANQSMRVEQVVLCAPSLNAPALNYKQLRLPLLHVTFALCTTLCARSLIYFPESARGRNVRALPRLFSAFMELTQSISELCCITAMYNSTVQLLNKQ